MSRFSVPGPDPATLLLESSANTPSSLRSDGHSGETPSTKSITRSREKIAAVLGGDPEPVGEAPLMGAKARLTDAIRDLTDEEAEGVLRVVDLLVRKNRAN